MRLTEQHIQDETISRIREDRGQDKSFQEIVVGFKKLLVEFDPKLSSFPIKQYFGEGLGQEKAKEKLINDGLFDSMKSQKRL